MILKQGLFLQLPGVTWKDCGTAQKLEIMISLKQNEIIGIFVYRRKITFQFLYDYKVECCRCLVNVSSQ